MINWFTLTVISILSLVSYYFLSKKLFNDNENVDPRFYGALLQFCTGLIALPLAIVNGLNFKFTPESLVLLSFLVAAYTIGPSLYYIGLKNTELSQTTILDSSGIAWSFLLGIIILREGITIEKIIGVLLIFAAILVASWRGTKSIRIKRYEWFIIASGLFYAIGAILDNLLVSYSTPTSYMALSFMLAGGTMFLVNLPRIRTVGIKTIRNNNFLRTIFINSLFIFITYYCIVKAYTLGGEVSKMYAIQQSESVLVPLLAVVILKERSRLVSKIIATTIAFGGILLLRG